MKISAFYLHIAKQHLLTIANNHTHTLFDKSSSAAEAAWYRWGCPAGKVIYTQSGEACWRVELSGEEGALVEEVMGHCHRRVAGCFLQGKIFPEFWNIRRLDCKK